MLCTMGYMDTDRLTPLQVEAMKSEMLSLVHDISHGGWVSVQLLWSACDTSLSPKQQQYFYKVMYELFDEGKIESRKSTNPNEWDIRICPLYFLLLSSKTRS